MKRFINYILQKKHMENKGAISIYLCLLLAVVLSVLLVVIEASRVDAMQTQIECSVDMSMDSCLAEYHRELLNRYDLLFIDTSYGENEGSLDKLSGHLTEYMTYNLSPQEDSLLLVGSSDLLGLSVSQVDILRASRATDNKGEVYRYMAVSYMLEHYGIAYISDIKDMVGYCESSSLFSGDIQQDNEDAQSQFNSFDPSDYEEGGDFEDFSVSNPTDEVNALRNMNILDVCGVEVSDKYQDLSSYASHRNLVAGDGLSPNYKDRCSIEEQLLFNEYLMLEFGNYRDKKEGSALDYELEYIISGKGSDRENLLKVCLILLNVRAVSNTIYYYSDFELQGEVKLAAGVISAAVCFPPIEPFVELILQEALIYGESAYDVGVLLDGGRVPLIKTFGDWNISLESLLADALGSVCGMDGESHNVGLSYQDYLRIMLYFIPLESRTVRSMDVIEMDIRNITGEETFRLDDCVCSLDVQMIVTSSYGYSCFLKRTFEYQ